MHHRHLSTMIALGLAVVGVGVLLAAGPTVETGARRFLADNDILGMLREVDRTNTELVHTNDRILKSLEGVSRQAGAVAGVHGRLTRLEAGLGRQQQAMAGLEQLTSEQVGLNRTLRDLAADARPATARLAETAGAQAAALERMSGLVGRQADAMVAIDASNRSIAEKLRRAEVLSATVLSRMP